MKRGDCIHHTGMLNPRTPCCSAGVNYRKHGDAKARPFGWVKRMPCLATKDYELEITPCPSYREVTTEDIEAHDRDMQMSLDRVLKVLPAVARWKQSNGPGSSGSIPCPICGAELQLASASSNGHVHASCVTAGCVSFME